jgi:RNA polymerase sigma factor (sigma-70 family)
MTAETQALLSRIAGQAATAYHRSHPWIDRADLEQEAWTETLQALPIHDPAGGPLSAYLATCAYRACKRFCWRMSVAANVPARTATAEKVARLRAASVDETALAVVAAEEDTAEERLAGAEESQRIAQVVAEYLARGQAAEAVKAVLYGEMPSREAAETFNVPVQAIYRRTEKIRAALKADPRIQEML